VPSLDHSVAEWMRQHHSIVSSSALAALGVSNGQRRRLVGAGVLERVVDGAYRFAGRELDDLARSAAICTSRPQLTIAGPTAGRIWNIRRSPRDGFIYVIGPPGGQSCREPWVKLYRTALLHDDEIVCRRDGIRLTSPPRTVIDLTRFLSPVELASAIEWVLSERICTAATLRRLAGRLDTPGRPWVRRFLGVLDGRVRASPRESEWEMKVHDALVAAGVGDLETQVWKDIPGYGRARFDMAIPHLRWALEVDVHPEHRTIEGQGGDHRRDRAARTVGYEIERVGEAALTANFDDEINALAASIEARRETVARLLAAGLWPPR
jgi:very-short-patch-repair endonuclease